MEGRKCEVTRHEKTDPGCSSCRPGGASGVYSNGVYGTPQKLGAKRAASAGDFDSRGSSCGAARRGAVQQTLSEPALRSSLCKPRRKFRNPKRVLDRAGAAELGGKELWSGGIRQLHREWPFRLQRLPQQRRTAKLQLRQWAESLFPRRESAWAPGSFDLPGRRSGLRSGSAVELRGGRISAGFYTCLVSAAGIRRLRWSRHHCSQSDTE